MRFDKDSALENSTDVTNLIFDELSMVMETTGGDDSRLYGNNEWNNRKNHNIVREGLIDSNQHEKKGVVK